MRPASPLTGITHTCAIRRGTHPDRGRDRHGAARNVVVRSIKDSSAASTCGLSSGDGIVIGNLFGIHATDADLTKEVELSLIGALAQWPDRRGREGLEQIKNATNAGALPDRTAVKAAGGGFRGGMVGGGFRGLHHAALAQLPVSPHGEHTMPEPVEDDNPEMSFRRGYQHIFGLSFLRSSCETP